MFCSEQSRLTREDELDTLAHFKRFRDAGVRVITKREGELDFGNTDTSLQQLARDLNRRGFRTPLNKTWSVQSVRHILTRACYKGMAAYNKTGQ